MSNKKHLASFRLSLGIGTLRSKFLTDFISNGRVTKESIASYKSGVSEVLNEYKAAYKQADIIEKEEMKKEIKQTKIKRRERHISNR